MKQNNFFSLLLILMTSLSFSQDLMISGIFDAGLSGGTPKGVELYVINDIADLSIYGIGSANNGGGSNGVEFTLPTGTAKAGDYIYIAHEGSNTGAFNTFFGFEPNYLNAAVSINGDDAIELFENKIVIDLFGDINVDGTNQPWEYTDGWAYRIDNKKPSTVFNPEDWTFSGTNVFDNQTSNSTTKKPIRLKTFVTKSFSKVAVWLGGKDNDWNDPLNWDTNMAPTAEQDVIIPAGLQNYPTLSQETFVNKITIESGATLISEVTTPINATVTYKRNIEDTNWHLIASPVKGEKIQNIVNNHPLARGSRENIGLATYTGSWNYFTSASTGNLDSGTGFSIKLLEQTSVSFTGNLVNESPIFEIARGVSDFYLIGNPFTANISSDLFFVDNEDNLTENTIWLWNGTSYETKVAVDDFKVAPTQGFFVKIPEEFAIIEFNTENQYHNTEDTFMRKNRTEVHLTLKEGTNESKARLYYIDGTTKGFDNGYDGSMFTGASYDLALFTELVANNKGGKYTVQSLPTNDIENTVVPVGVIAKAGKELTFNAQSINLPEGVEVYLEDRVNNTVTNLSGEDYKVTLNENVNGAGQFYLHTTSQRLSVAEVAKVNDNKDASIYVSGKSEITVTGLQTKNAVLNVYNTLGKEVYTTTISSNGVTKVNLPELAAGIYVVKVEGVSKKVVLK